MNVPTLGIFASSHVLLHVDDTSVEGGGVKEETEAAETPEVSEVPAKVPEAGEAAAETETPVLPEVAEAAEMIDPLAKKITEYILDHQDDAAQEDRWRTTMKRETMKCFREQREASGNQRAAIDSRFDRQREEVKAGVQKVETEVQAVKVEVQKIEAGVQKVEMEMQQRFDEVHSKMDEKMDQLVKNIADLVKQH